MSKLQWTVSRLLALGGLTAVSGSGLALYKYSLSGDSSAECRPAAPNLHTDYGRIEIDSFQYKIPNSWDDNWDFRKPANKDVDTTSIPVVERNGTTTNVSTKPLKSTATRHIILVRHGQYISAADDRNKILTNLGRSQASVTGQRLKSLNITFDKIHASTMTRAQETANIIGESFPDVPKCECTLLREGAPYPPEPSSRSWKPAHHEFFQDYPRIEGAFRKYIHRAPPEQTEDSHELIVCHANVIRYFVCRALQFPPEGWLRMKIGNCGLTWLSIRPNGNVSLRGLGDVGHLPPEMVTFS